MSAPAAVIEDLTCLNGSDSEGSNRKARMARMPVTQLLVKGTQSDFLGRLLWGSPRHERIVESVGTESAAGQQAALPLAHVWQHRPSCRASDPHIGVAGNRLSR